jgi:hypothetical protein
MLNIPTDLESAYSRIQTFFLTIPVSAFLNTDFFAYLARHYPVESAQDLPGSAEDLPGSAEDLPGSAEDLPGSAETLAGSPHSQPS